MIVYARPISFRHWFTLGFNSNFILLLIYLRRMSRFKTSFPNALSVAEYLTSCSILKFPLISYGEKQCHAFEAHAERLHVFEVHG